LASCLPPPTGHHMRAWQDFFASKPQVLKAEFKKVITSIIAGDTNAYDYDVEDLLREAAPHELVSCQVCGLLMRAGNAMNCHMTHVHGRRADYPKFAFENGRCQICMVQFASRLALKQHLWQGIKKKGKHSCYDQFLLLNITPLSILELDRCDAVDRDYIKEKKRLGLSPLQTAFRAFRASGPLRQRAEVQPELF
jgi:hypothetical protein